ncbi:MAG: formylglycine-generating enzyme family protein [Pseudomonadota bacterium]
MIRRSLLLIGLVAYQTAQAEPANLDWVTLDGACFQMGETRLYPEEAPRHEACVDAFEMTRTEITVAQFSEFVRATDYVTRAERGWQASDPTGPGIALPPGSAVFHPLESSRPQDLNWWRWVDGANWRHPAGPGAPTPPSDHPVTQMTRDDANAFAQWAGGRLPTEAEWEYAARGGLDSELLAWGAAERQAQHDMANTWQGVFPVVNTKADGFDDAAPVASFPANGFGLHDMIGNVWEWTATPHAPSHAAGDRALAGETGLDFAQPDIAVGTIKGGSFLCATSYCYRFRPAARQAQDLAYGTSHIGFRIVRTSQTRNGPGRPEPS